MEFNGVYDRLTATKTDKDSVNPNSKSADTYTVVNSSRYTDRIHIVARSDTFVFSVLNSFFNVL